MAPWLAMRRPLWPRAGDGRRLALWRANGGARMSTEREAEAVWLPKAAGPPLMEAERRRREFELLPTVLEPFVKSTGHWFVPRPFRVPVLDEDGKWTVVDQYERVLPGRVADATKVEWPEGASGYALGYKLRGLLATSKTQEEFPHVVEAIRALGVPREAFESWPEYVWREQTMAALRAYHHVHGDSHVPSRFVVPRDDPMWPVAIWGLRLGALVSTIRTYKATLTPSQLEDLAGVEFTFDVAKTTWSDAILPSLEVFKQVNGHCRVPRPFMVPSSSPWPKKAWGFNLGSAVNHIRSREHYVLQVQRDSDRLEALGFVWDVYEDEWSMFVLPALETFSQVFGHCRVGREFSVPAETPWPQHLWGYRLGQSVMEVRIQGVFKKQTVRDADKLTALGFIWDCDEFTWSERVLPALECFRHVHGHCRVLQDFVVPSEHPWPDSAWGMKLGKQVNSMRTKLVFKDQISRDMGRLEAIGFVWHPRDLKWRTQILPALQTHFMIHGHTHIRWGFVVPSDSPWPKETWGLRLYQTVEDMRLKSTYKAQVARDRKELEAIQFGVVQRTESESEWDDIILPSLETHCRVTNNGPMKNSFVVPAEDSWPRSAWGFVLGKVVQDMERSGLYSAYVWRDRDRLASIGMFGFTKEDIKWNQCVLPALETFYGVNGHSDVGKSFVVPSHVPWPEATWNLRLGPVVSRMRAKGQFSVQAGRDVDRLEAIKFVWDTEEAKWSEVVLPSLETFHDEYGHCNVPRSFVVPSSPPWPERAWGFGLHAALRGIRKRGTLEKQRRRDAARLERLGLRELVDIEKDV